MTILTDMGKITISADAISSIAGFSATNCFGVKGMTVTGMTDGITRLLRREAMTKGVKIREYESAIDIDLHIAVEHGINISTVCRSIINEVRYTVEQFSGIEVKNIEVYVDSIKVD